MQGTRRVAPSGCKSLQRKKLRSSVFGGEKRRENRENLVSRVCSENLRSGAVCGFRLPVQRMCVVRFRLIFFWNCGKVDEEKMHCHEQTDEYTHTYTGEVEVTR